MDTRNLMEHERYVELKNKNQVEHLMNMEKTAEYGCGFVGDEKLSNSMRKFLKFKKREMWVWIFGVVSLFTPLKVLILLAFFYSALSFIFSKLAKKYIVSSMYESKSFYDYIVKDKKVVVPVFVGDGSNKEE